MRKFITMGALAGLAVLVYAQVSGSSLVAGFSKALNASKSVSATINSQVVNGTVTNYKIDLAKPNMARIDGPNTLVVADGKNITTYDKKDNTYFKKPETDADLKALLDNDDFSMLAPFFDADAYAKLSSKAAGTKNRKGVSYNVVDVNMDGKGKRTISFYIDPKDSITRLAEVNLSMSDKDKSTIIVSAKDMVLDGSMSNDTFAFAPPTDSRELSLDEMSAGTWYTDLEQAKALAKKTNKKIFVDFMATWCGPCKMLDHDVLQTAEFKKLSQYFVFARIDVDAQPAVAQHYGITAMPTQMVLAADGSVVSQTVGYGGPERFYSWINSSK